MKKISCAVMDLFCQEGPGTTSRNLGTTPHLHIAGRSEESILSIFLHCACSKSVYCKGNRHQNRLLRKGVHSLVYGTWGLTTINIYANYKSYILSSKWQYPTYRREGLSSTNRLENALQWNHKLQIILHSSITNCKLLCLIWWHHL